MDPARLSNNPPKREVSRPHRSPTSPQHGHPLSGPASHQSLTALPSIRQLDLPPPRMSQGGEGSNYAAQLPYAQGGGSPHTSHEEQGSASQGHNGRGGGEQEEDRDQQGPPKKKRRRQALSCTECKRRKIKCDRTQPCGPCTRRNEQAKCHWHIVEPVEKYVTREEYDALKARFDNLEAWMYRVFPSAPVNMPPYQIGAHPGVPVGGAAGGVTSAYTAPPQDVIVYPPVMSPVYSQHMDTSRPQHRYSKSDDLQQSSPRYQPPSADSARSLSSSQSLQTSFPSQSPISRQRPLDDKSPSVGPRIPLSLASITSPFNYSPDRHPKNYQAQMPILGERLRPMPLYQGGPENPIPPQICRRPEVQSHHQASRIRPIYI